MSTDTDGAGDGGGMEKIDVRVPAGVLEAIDEEYGRRGYASRSEAIRDALRDWLNPSPELSDEILDELEEIVGEVVLVATLAKLGESKLAALFDHLLDGPG